MKFEGIEIKLNGAKEILKDIGTSLKRVEKNTFTITKDLDYLKIIGENMKEIIGTVANIKEGVFSVKGANGNIKTLNTGDEILKNEIVYGEVINTDSSVIEITLVNNKGIITLTGEQEVKFDSSLSKTIVEEVAFNKEDITAILETASGQEESEEQDENSFKATFDTRDGDLTNIQSDLRDTLAPVDEKKENDNITFFEEIQEQPKIEPTLLLGKITLDTPKNTIEGEDITVTANVDNAPETDLIITLNNGEQITIKAGDLSGTVTFNPYADDKYIQGDRTLDLSISNTQGGNFEKLDTTVTAKVTVKDDEDVTKISLDTPKDVIEGEDITVTATVDNAPETDLVITLNNGEQITIKANETTGTVTFNPYADDKYIQGDRTLDLSISNTQGGNFEKLDTTVTAKVTVKDDEDVTKISLDTPKDVIEGEDITVTATVDNAPETDLVITLNNGEQITIKANETTGTVTFNPYADDKYIQGDRTLDLSISNTQGGNFEKLDTTVTAKVTVKDDEDVTNVSITTTKKISYEIENIEANKTTDKTGEAGDFKYRVNEINDNLKRYNDMNKSPVSKDIIDTLPKIEIIAKNDKTLSDENGTYYILSIKVLSKKTENFTIDISDTKINIPSTDAVPSEYTIKVYDKNMTIAEDVYADGISLGKNVVIQYESMSKGVLTHFSNTQYYGDSYVDTTQVNLTSEIVGDKIIFKVQTSNPPYYKNNEEWSASLRINGKYGSNNGYLVNLDKDGKGTLTLNLIDVINNGKVEADVYIINATGSYRNFEDISYGSSNISIKKEVTYEIETSNAPDLTKYDFITTFPTATVEVQKDNKTETYTINLNKAGKGTLTLDTTNLTKEPIIKVVEVDGNFEDVDLSNVTYKENQTETTGETTTITPTKIMLSNVEVIEGQDITVTANVDNAPKTDLMIELNNGEQITIKAGELTGTVTFKNPYADDKYVQGDRALDLSISNTTGGDYKILDTTATAKVTVKDDLDVTNVSITKTVVYEEVNINKSNITTENTGKSYESFIKKWENNTSVPIGQNIVNGGDLTVKDFYIKDNEVKKDSVGNMYVDIVLVLKNPAKYDIEFSVDKKYYFTIKAGETTGTVKYDYFAKDFSDDVYYKGGNFVDFGIFLQKVNGEKIISQIIKFDAVYVGDGHIDTTTANLDYKDNLDGTVTIKIELSNPPKLMTNVYYGNIEVSINGNIKQIELSNEQEYFLTVDKVFKNGKFDVKIQDIYSKFEDVSHDSTITIKEGYQKYEIETSNIPDPTKYDFVKTFPTATVEVQKDSTKDTYTINLDKNGKGTLTLDATGLTKEPIIKVIEVDGNFEETNVFDKKSLDLNMNFADDNIDLSNLSAIIEDNQLNLKNGVENKLLNISLEDVLKISPEKLITIKGDEFDKVTFKDTLANDGTENNWSKTAGTGENSGYDIYINSGDLNVQVKVEQPISDGITS
ncbi:hypothetical protein CRU92_00760 [Arcobacter sp. FW59]|nr:hypothetical protein CRU92_00760 [Arcobacter sp. FW59]